MTGSPSAIFCRMFGHEPVRAVWVERVPVWRRGVFGGHEVSYKEGEVCGVCQETIRVVGEAGAHGTERRGAA